MKKLLIGLILLSIVGCSTESQANDTPEDITTLPAQIDQPSVIYTDSNGSETVYIKAEVIDQLDAFMLSLNASEFEKTAEESGYECGYDGSFKIGESDLFYNESYFMSDHFIHIVVRNDDVDKYYEVDSQSELASQFKEILNLFNHE